MSDVSGIADETRHVHELLEATSAKARSVHGQVESKVATLAGKVDASVAHVVEEMTGRVREVAAYSDAQASCIAETITQQPEQEIQAAGTSTATIAEIQTCTIVEGIRIDVQVQLEQNHADALHRDTESQHKVEQIAAQLQKLTEQLNQFRPTSEENVGEVRKQVSEQFDQRLECSRAELML